MLRTLVASLAAAISLAPSFAWCAPPPPPPPLPELAQPVDGYNLQIPYSIWRGWIERRKGQAVREILAAPEDLKGEQAMGWPLLGFTRSNDFGPYLVGEIRVFCAAGSALAERTGCHYRLRRVYVAHDAGSYRMDNPVAQWMRDNFDAKAVAAHLRREGLAPETDWWRAEAAQMFSSMPSPVPMLKENATVAIVDSRDCPALGRSIEALESTTKTLRIDFLAVGKDEVTAPWPHSIQTTFKLTSQAAGPGGQYTIEGSGDFFEAIAAPILKAADDCESARRRPG